MAENFNTLTLTGLQPLPYLDIPAQLTLQTVSPTSANYSTRPYKNFQIGTFWLNITDQSLWYLAKILTSPKHEGDWVEIASGAGNVEEVPTDVGTAIPLAGILNIITNQATRNSGSSVFFSGSENTVQLNVTDANNNTIIGKIAGNLAITGLNNTAFGPGSAASLTTGAQNTLIGSVAGNSITTGSSNTILGRNAGAIFTTGSNNIIIGQSAADNYDASESNNIIIGNAGTVSENNTIRIGTQGSGSGQQNTAYMAGIIGNAVANAEFVSINSVTGQLGVISGGGIATTYQGDNGTAAPSGGILQIITGQSALNCGSSVQFTASSNIVELNVTDADNNTIMGKNSGNATISSFFNTGFGYNVLSASTSGESNAAFGALALDAVTSGVGNTGIGINAGSELSTGGFNTFLGNSAGWNGGGGPSGITTGNNNVCVGYFSGHELTSSESNNIIIGTLTRGLVGESNVLQIGTATGTGDGMINQCFISGIRGITTGNNDAVAVLVDSANQLGTVSSSARYKENIKDMGSESEIIYNLRPVTFNYKKHPNAPAWGLIAEEVEEVFPQLVVFKDNQPESVKYHDLVPLLLNEVIKLRKRIEIMEREE